MLCIGNILYKYWWNHSLDNKLICIFLKAIGVCGERQFFKMKFILPEYYCALNYIWQLYFTICITISTSDYSMYNMVIDILRIVNHFQISITQTVKYWPVAEEFLNQYLFKQSTLMFFGRI